MIEKMDIGQVRVVGNARCVGLIVLGRCIAKIDELVDEVNRLSKIIDKESKDE